MRRLIIAYKHPCDYTNPETLDELSDEGQKRLEILFKRVTVDYYRNQLSRVRIFTEAHKLDDLHANILAGMFNDQDVGVSHIVDYDNLMVELSDVVEESFPDYTVFVFLHAKSIILSEMVKRTNEVFLYSMLPSGLMLPPSDDELGIIMDRKFLRPQRIQVSTLKNPQYSAAT